MSATFFWGSTLVLALQHPVTFNASNALWLSTKNSVKAQSLPGKVVLTPVKLGAFYITGASIGAGHGSGALTETLVTTQKNLVALTRCKIKSKASMFSVEGDEIAFRERTLAKFPADCGFDRVRFADASIESQTDRIFAHAESRTKSQGVSLGLADWRNGRRHLVVYSSLDAAELARKFPTSLLPFYEFDYQSKVSPGRNLIFELTLFEFSRDRAQNLGIKWPKNLSFLSLDPSASARLKMQGGAGGVGVDLSADFGESQGVGKVLAQPTLRTQPGVESRFLSGGEFPITNSNAFHSQTSWKSYGLKVALTPSESAQTGDREVSVDFKLEFSEPNPAQTVGGIPGLLQRQLESRFDVRMDYLTILTTMVTLRESRGRDGLYFLSQLPILSALFGQNTNSRNNSELWFALKPTWDEIPMSAARDKPVRFENSL